MKFLISIEIEPASSVSLPSNAAVRPIPVSELLVAPYRRPSPAVQPVVVHYLNSAISQIPPEIPIVGHPGKPIDLRAIVDTIPGLLVCALPDGSIEIVNQGWQEYTGRSSEELTGWGWQAAIHADDLPKFMEEWNAARAAGQPLTHEASDSRQPWGFLAATRISATFGGCSLAQTSGLASQKCCHGSRYDGASESMWGCSGAGLATHFDRGIREET